MMPNRNEWLNLEAEIASPRKDAVVAEPLAGVLGVEPFRLTEILKEAVEEESDDESLAEVTALVVDDVQSMRGGVEGIVEVAAESVIVL